MGSKKLIYLAIVIVNMFFISNSAFAKKERYTNALEGAKGNLKKDSAMIVSDPNSSIPATSWNSYLVLRINELYGKPGTVSLPDSFTVSIKVTLATNTYGSNQPPLLSDTVLHLEYNRYKATNPRALQYLGAQSYVGVTVQEVTIGQAAEGRVLPYLVLESYLDIDRVYDLDCTADLINGLSSYLNPAGCDPDEIPISWQKVVAADEYDVEWTWIDKNALESNFYGPAANPDLNAVFTNNSSRITVTSELYNIPLLFNDTGVLFYRVRPVQYQTNSERKVGKWSAPNIGGNGTGRYAFTGHQPSLNWQASTSFAEDGKRKSVVQYFDGTSRSRQTVTKDNTTGTTVVAESLYDRQGRPMIQVLPTPTLKFNNKIHARN